MKYCTHQWEWVALLLQLLNQYPDKVAQIACTGLMDFLMRKKKSSGCPQTQQQCLHPGFQLLCLHPGFQLLCLHPGFQQRCLYPGFQQRCLHPGICQWCRHPRFQQWWLHPGFQQRHLHPGFPPSPGSAQDVRVHGLVDEGCHLLFLSQACCLELSPDVLMLVTKGNHLKGFQSGIPGVPKPQLITVTERVENGCVIFHSD